MKKLTAIIMAIGMMLAFAACGDTTDTTSSDAGSVNRPTVSTGDSGTSSTPSVSAPSDTSSEPAVPAREDLALSATAFCDENKNHVDGIEYAATCVNDEDPTTAWQKDGSINAGDNNTWDRNTLYGEDAEIYVGLEWTEAQNIDTVVIDNSQSTAMETYENGGYTLEYFDGENWVEVTGLEDTRVTASERTTITLTFDAVSTTKIRLNVIKGIAASKHSPKIYTMSVYAAEETAEGDTSADASDVISE